MSDASLKELGISADLIQPAEIKKPGTSTIDFDGLLSTPLLLHEDLSKGCGGQLWPAGMVLSKYLLSEKVQQFKGKSILEIGAGGGIVGLSVAIGCSNYESPVHITDQNVMLDLMNKNIDLNNLQDKVKATVYDWGQPIPDGLPSHPDILLVADAVYFEPAFPLLQQTLQDLIGPRTICYFCFKKRRRADMYCIKVIKKLFDVNEIQDDPDRENYRRESIFLLQIVQKKK